MDSMKSHGCKFLEGRRVTEFTFDEETGCITEVSCGKESLKADAVILAVGISTMQDIIQNRFVIPNPITCTSTFPCNPVFLYVNDSSF